MKIVVLAGGTSRERDVSLSSGNGVYNALKEKGHEVVLIDLYLGYETQTPLAELFTAQHNCCGDIQKVSEKTPDIEELRKLRKDGGKSIFGPNVLSWLFAIWLTLYSWLFMVPTVKTDVFRQHFT